MNRFYYPERCIIFLSTCYLMVSFGFLIRIYVGHENVACDILTNTKELNNNNNLLSLIRYENTGQIPGNNNN